MSQSRRLNLENRLIRFIYIALRVVQQPSVFKGYPVQLCAQVGKRPIRANLRLILLIWH